MLRLVAAVATRSQPTRCAIEQDGQHEQRHACWLHMHTRAVRNVRARGARGLYGLRMADP